MQHDIAGDLDLSSYMDHIGQFHYQIKYTSTSGKLVKLTSGKGLFQNSLTIFRRSVWIFPVISFHDFHSGNS